LIKFSENLNIYTSDYKEQGYQDTFQLKNSHLYYSRKFLIGEKMFIFNLLLLKLVQFLSNLRKTFRIYANRSQLSFFLRVVYKFT